MSKLVAVQSPRSEPQVPGLFTLAWLLFMQPVTLHARLRACGIDGPNAPAWRLWWDTGDSLCVRHAYIRRMFKLMVLLTPLLSLAMTGLLSAFGCSINVSFVALGSMLGVAFGATSGLVFGVVSGAITGLSTGIVLALFLGTDDIVASNTVVAGAHGAAIGIAIGMASGVAAGVAAGVAHFERPFLVASLPVCLLFGLYFGMTGGLAYGVTISIAMFSAILMSFFKVWTYPVEAACVAAQYSWQCLTGTTTLHWSPVLFHELSYVPYPLLQHHILLTAEREPELVHRVLRACAVAPGQRQIGRRAGMALQARELERLGTEGQFSHAVELQGEWMLGIQGASDVLLAFSESARYLAAATATSNPLHRLGHLQRAEERLRSLERQLSATSSFETQLFIAPLKQWQETTKRSQSEAATAAAARLPNVFRSNEPLTPESGGELFRGRENLIRRIEETLVAPEASGSLVLLGPRRCGKSSLLRMLPAKLPDAVCVFFDLQDNPVSSPAAFWKALARRAYEQARRDRKLHLPQMPDGPVVEAAAQWLDRLETLDGGYRILLCIDEFERLESLYPGDRRELLQLLGLIRATIQHKRRVRWLVAGVAPFDELDQLWTDHFINARELRVEHLDRPTSLELLTKPSCEFPDDILPASVAEAVYQRTGGQPMLLQLYGSLIVERLNQQERRHATPADIEPVELEVLLQAGAYLRDTLNKSPDHVCEALQRLASEETIELERRTLRWLRRRCLVTEGNQLAIPVLGRWIRECWEN